MAGTAGTVLPPILSDSINASKTNKDDCQTDEDYWQKNKKACQDAGWFYNRGNRQNDKNDEQCKKWKKSNPTKYSKICKHALADFFANYKDAELIFDILTAGRDGEDENIQDGDSKDDLEGTQDE